MSTQVKLTQPQFLQGNSPIPSYSVKFHTVCHGRGCGYGHHGLTFLCGSLENGQGHAVMLYTCEVEPVEGEEVIGCIVIVTCIYRLSLKREET